MGGGESGDTAGCAEHLAFGFGQPQRGDDHEQMVRAGVNRPVLAPGQPVEPLGRRHVLL
ncbi:hypothetical protein BN2475_90168 [Paraburkholderia ribeironis]|uniref:Uncharacterized protein n=1 Tax=Paraburkholderia ribeironis TaxID=1247936 RepID=A0A1N7RNP7_9BURK|nr:hypothetical protein BN2475_90168 [Paraburkholderia ribeironis]